MLVCAEASNWKPLLPVPPVSGVLPIEGAADPASHVAPVFFKVTVKFVPPLEKLFEAELPIVGLPAEFHDPLQRKVAAFRDAQEKKTQQPRASAK